MLIPRLVIKSVVNQASEILRYHHYDPSTTEFDLFSAPNLFVSLSSNDNYDSVFSNQDLEVGTFIALLLSFLFSLLHSKNGSMFPSLTLWPKNSKNIPYDSNAKITDHNDDDDSNTRISLESLKVGEVVFDDWAEMSRPENYILYSTKIRNKSMRMRNLDRERTNEINFISTDVFPPKDKENKMILLALLMLFIPIFSVEFFFALSRQFVCGNYVSDPDDAMILNNPYINYDLSPWAKELCSPHLEHLSYSQDT